jgi:kynurenine formamidase
MSAVPPNIDTVRDLAKRYCNWGRWGDDDQVGTLNHVHPEDVAAAAGLIRSGSVVSLSIPLDDRGPQHAGSGRFNPIHFMSIDGRDYMSGSGTPEERDRRRGYLQNADGVLILPLQSGTQWDGLAHVFFEQQMYNGYSAGQVTSRGAQRNGVSLAADRIVGRGVLLDLPAAQEVPHLEPGYAIGGRDLDAASRAQGTTVRRGDFVLVRTGALARVRQRGAWEGYAGGDAPGMGLDSVPWVADHEIAGLATDLWDVEVRPAETPDVAQPLHILFIVQLGLWLGEIFDLEELARRCRAENRYEFFFVAQPLVITGGVGSPINPVAIL